MNTETMPLSCMPVGSRGEIVAIHPAFRNRERLTELGFTKDTEIISLHVSPIGDPTAYFIRGSVMALRKEDADNIFVKIKEEY